MEEIKKRGNITISLLNLPESILDCILKRLSPIELINLSEACTSLRDACRSDHLWENHFKQKWGRIIGDTAFKEWQWHISKLKSEETIFNQNGSLGSFCGAWPVLCLGSYLEDCKHLKSFLANNSMMGLYMSLESGKFWFPAQLYRRARATDALISYDSRSDTFKARQLNGECHLWERIRWGTLRACTVGTPPCVRHVSDCLDDLKPGDHIEIQQKPKPHTRYEWLYAVIGHLGSCHENEEEDCRCHNSETLVVDLQCFHGMDLRPIKLQRHNNGEQESQYKGIYGGIRKLQSEEEIEKWMELLPHDRWSQGEGNTNFTLKGSKKVQWIPVT